jgi:DUF4097 and DUF4098 domain-containing protein YvlB
MKKYFLLLIFACSALILNAQWNQEKDPFMTKPLSNESIKNIKMQTTGGNITVSSVNSSEARLEVYVQPSNSRTNVLTKEEIQKRLDEDYDLTITVSDNKLVATAKAKHDNRDWDWRRQLNISFKVFVSQNVSTDLSTSGGNISLTAISGNQEFRTSGGNLKLDNVGGKIKGRTSGGNITLLNSKDDIDLSTSGGNVEAENSNGTIRLSTSGGNVRIKGLKGDIKATTSGGNVKGDNISGELETHTSGGSIIMTDLACSLEASTSGGSIDVEVSQLGKYITLHNSGGSIDLVLPKDKGIDLDLSASRIKTGTLNNFSGKMEDDEVRGKLNNGGIPVKVRTSGTIHFSQR